VRVRLRGRLRPGVARVVEREDPRWDVDRQVYVARWRRLAGKVTGPIVEIELTGEA
jgi:hypothetical protein